jgi:hypothetical protein
MAAPHRLRHLRCPRGARTPSSETTVGTEGSESVHGARPAPLARSDRRPSQPVERPASVVCLTPGEVPETKPTATRLPSRGWDSKRGPTSTSPDPRATHAGGRKRSPTDPAATLEKRPICSGTFVELAGRPFRVFQRAAGTAQGPTRPRLRARRPGRGRKGSPMAPIATFDKCQICRGKVVELVDRASGVARRAESAPVGSDGLSALFNARVDSQEAADLGWRGVCSACALGRR